MLGGGGGWFFVSFFVESLKKKGGCFFLTIFFLKFKKQVQLKFAFRGEKACIYFKKKEARIYITYIPYVYISI
jgi:hypothetical protein